MEDPAAALSRSHELLDHGGLLVVRVPNAEFYRQQRRQLIRSHSRQALKLLGYNNLLGFPYLHGYTPAALDRLLRTSRFEPVAVHGTSLLTPPYPQMSPNTHQEWLEARREGESLAESAGPWIEIVSRRA